jgi:hypothetical protein
VNRDLVEQVLRDYEALRRPDMDAGLEAVRLAILLEDVLGVTVADADIDPAVCADPAAVTALVTRLGGAV